MADTVFVSARFADHVISLQLRFVAHIRRYVL